MRHPLSFSLAVVLGSFALAGGCSDESENPGLSNASPPAPTGTTPTGPDISVGGGETNEEVPGPPPPDEPDPSEPDPLDCSALRERDECGGTSLAPKLEPVNVLLVIDKSGSMADEPEGFDVDKWTALETALGEALGAGNFPVNYGLLLFPDQAIDEVTCIEGCCAVPGGADAINVPIEVGTNSVRAVLLEIADTSPGGGTPTAAALSRAVDYFTSGAGAELEGNNYVLLATDGGPNCNSELTCEAATCTTNMDGACMRDGSCCDNAGDSCLDDLSVLEQIAALQAEGIKTFVVGIPGTEAYAGYLDTFATAGGVPNPDGSTQYYAVEAADGVDALRDTFTEITNSLIRSCTIPLAEEPPSTDDLNVAVDCEILNNTDDAAWVIPEDSPNTVVLQGEICIQVETEGAERIDVVYGCSQLR